MSRSRIRTSVPRASSRPSTTWPGWDRNFESAGVGGAEAIAALHAPGVLNSGREIRYASGLALGRYRGLRTVEHGGVDAGYRAHLLRFAEQRLTVILLGNASDLDTGVLTRRVADLYLQGTPGFGPVASFPDEVELEAGALKPFLGDFEMRPGLVLRFTAEGGRLMVQGTGQPRYALFASGADAFFTKAFEASVRFDPPAADGVSATALWRQGGRELPLRRLALLAPPTAEALQAYTGDYYSDELRAMYTVALRDGALRVRYPRGELTLQPVTPDVFSAAHPLGTLRFARTSGAGAAAGFTVTTGRVRNLRFRRVQIGLAG